MTIHTKPMTASAPDTSSEIRVVYVLRSSRNRTAFLTLMSELQSVTRTLMESAGAKAGGYSMMERTDRDGWFIETMRFGSEQERNRFDDLYCLDRKASALQGLLNDLVDGARSDYVLTRRQSRGCAPAIRSTAKATA
jgi:hypothetical protein